MTTNPASGSRSGAAVVTLEHVSKRYGPAGGPHAVEDLSLTIPAGEICVLVGPSGCGKTTTMKMINRLIEPTSGRITIDGDDVMSLPPVELRRRIGYVIQQVGLFPHLTVAENVAVVPRLLRWPESRIRARVEELLDLVRLDAATYSDRYPSALSGGERQRVGVARALAADPPLMLMDEPFGAVDPILRDRLQNEFLRLQAQVRKTIVFVTHDVDEAIKMADRIAILQRGGILAQFDTPDAILAAPASEFVEHFVGADRGLKRLSLGRVRDLPLSHPTTARAGDARADLRQRLDEAGSDYALLLDGADRPVGWIGRRAIGGEGTVSADDATPGSPTLQPETTLRDALSAMLGSSVQLGVVVDESERVLGVISVNEISDVLRAPGGLVVIDGQPLFQLDWVLAHLDVLAQRVEEHLLVTVIAVAVGFAISFALALAVRRYPRTYGPILAVSGVLYSIPSIALFVLFIPITGLSLLTAEIALVSYTLVILVRNIVTGLRAVPAEVIEAARGMGYTDRQRLWRVELPIALPIIVAGLRIATVTTIGLVTIATLIGMGGLGYLIVNIGVQRRFPTATITGVVIVVILSTVIDLGFQLLQRRLTPWARAREARA